MTDELDALIEDADDAAPVEAAPEPEAIAAPEPESESVEGETETTDAVVTDPEPPSGESSAKPVHVPVEALVAEREKRQALERKLAEFEQRSHEPAKLPDVLEDQDGFVNEMRAMIEQTRAQDRIATSRMLVASMKDDYAEKEAVFMQLAEGSPLLVDQMLAAENPALFAYETANKHAELQALKDVDGYKEKLRAEVEAEIRAKIEAESKTESERKAALAKASGVPNLASIPGAGTSAVEVPGDDDLASLLDGR